MRSRQLIQVIDAHGDRVFAYVSATYPMSDELHDAIEQLAKVASESMRIDIQRAIFITKAKP